MNVSVRSSTFSENSASNGGAICSCEVDPGSSVNIKNSLFKSGSSGANLVGARFTSAGYNLSNDNGGGFLTATGDQLNTDPLLAHLQNNGAPTMTNALLAGSPAIDAGDPLFGPAGSADQRGRSRVIDGNNDSNARLDIGAYERQAPASTTVSISGRVMSPFGRGVTNASVNISNSAGFSQTITTGRGGSYEFAAVPAGTLTLRIGSRRFAFGDVTLFVDDRLTEVNFTPNGAPLGLQIEGTADLWRVRRTVPRYTQ